MQSKLESLVESCINIASGFIISLLVWTYIVAPLYNIEVNQTQNIQITGIFTISAIIRSYFWRRFFAVGIHRKLKGFKWM